MLFTYIQPCKARQNDREAQEALGAGCKIVTTPEHGVCKSLHRNHLRRCHSSLTRHFRGASDRARERERELGWLFRMEPSSPRPCPSSEWCQVHAVLSPVGAQTAPQISMRNKGELARTWCSIHDPRFCELHLQGTSCDNATWAHPLAHLCTLTRQRRMSNTCCCLPLDATDGASERASERTRCYRFYRVPLPSSVPSVGRAVCPPSIMAIPTFRQTEAAQVGRVSQLPECVTRILPGSGGAVKRDGTQVRTFCIQIPPLSIVGMGGGSVIIESVASSINDRQSGVHWPRGGRTDGRGGDSDETCCWTISRSA